MKIYKAKPFFTNQLKQLSEINTSLQIFYLFKEWILIFLCIFLSLELNNFFIYGLAIVIIATRQHALLVLVHDAAHFRIAKSKFLNDFLANCFAAFPCFIGTQAYRSHHLKHHQFLNTSLDPDWARKVHLSEWKFPMSKSLLFWTLFKQILIGGFQWVHLTSLMLFHSFKAKSEFKKESLYLIFFMMAVGTGVSFLNLWSELVLYWLAPLLIVFPLIQRFRSITEHFAVSRDQILDQTRNINANAFEKFFISPYSVNRHLVHHLFPSIPHYHLEKAHQYLLTDPIYAEGQHLNEAYIFPFKKSVLQDLLK